VGCAYLPVCLVHTGGACKVLLLLLLLMLLGLRLRPLASCSSTD